MKKILIKKILNSVKNGEEFENRMISALRVGASEENFLCILCEGMIESANIPEDFEENFLESLRKTESNNIGDNLKIERIVISPKSEEICVYFSSQVERWYRSEENAKEASPYNGCNKQSADFRFKGICRKEDYHRYDSEEFEELGGVITRK